MLIEDFEKLLNRIDLKRLHDISDLQKSILRRQNRCKRILNLYLRLYEKWFTFINTREEIEKSLDTPITLDRNIAKKVNKSYHLELYHDDVFGSDGDNAEHTFDVSEHSDSSFDSGFYDEEENTDSGFWDYHKLLTQIIEKHLIDSDDLKSTLIQECSTEVENNRLLHEQRTRIENIQMELSTQYNTEYKISRTIKASKAPNLSYVGFMENVLSGMAIPTDEQIDFDEYSKYCQVKWMLESVEVESHSQCHKMFDQASDFNRLQDQILDVRDAVHAIELFKNYKNVSSCHMIKPAFVKNLQSWQCFQNTNEGECFRNLLNIYGFDNYIQYNDYYDSCYELLDRNTEESIDQMNENGTKNTNEILTNEIIREKKRDSFLKYLESDHVPEYPPLDPKDFEEALSYEMNRLSASFMEKISEVKENLLKNLDGSLKQKSSHRKKDSSSYIQRTSHRISKSSVARSSSVIPTSNTEEIIVHQRSSSDTSTPQKTSPPNKNNLTTQNSKSSDGSPRRRLGTRRHKLPRSSRDLFFLPAPDESDDNEKVERSSGKSLLALRMSGQNVEVIVDDDLEQQLQRRQPVTVTQKHHSLNSKPSEHKKLCRSRGRYSEQDVKKMSDELFDKKLINIQTIMVDGERLKIADFSDKFDRLSVKNRPRKLSIKNRNKGRNK